ncbi:MAG: hypothetical protein CVV64_02415 [Candidatus Wallbacteria bacterium HGW-Wallbacteria-1]|jgi:predicted membrane-bound spermidine synthase|uniref:Polyamine aminopropyltransferase n=1 Tax=Candidatus Wallbacteria bacterium HGW-Wallbacteria-1 TaxID=2013854 RepID=A0A2N1PVF0_9BACT|nr:MAG: hypothetical protein CVV64_02415 [Candidatus Wallbacteria bacterium HGW-Wallbacteria-1]
MIRTIFLLLVVVLMGYRYYNPPFPEAHQFSDPIIAAVSTSAHRMVTAKRGEYYNFYMDSNLLFSTCDSHRFFETLVHPLFSALGESPSKILLIGNPSGMILKEILKYRSVAEVLVIGFDRGIQDFFTFEPHLPAMALTALKDSRVKYEYPAEGMEQKESEVVFEHLRVLAETRTGYFDAVVINVTDPVDRETGNFYSERFYARIKTLLTDRGAMVTQAGSTFFTPITAGVIRHTAASVFGNSLILRANVPSIGEWGFVLAGNTEISAFSETPKLRIDRISNQFDAASTQSISALRASSEASSDVKSIINPLRFLNQAQLDSMSYVPKDRVPSETWVHKFGEDDLHREYLDEWSDYVRTEMVEED